MNTRGGLPRAVERSQSAERGRPNRGDWAVAALAVMLDIFAPRIGQPAEEAAWIAPLRLLRSNTFDIGSLSRQIRMPTKGAPEASRSADIDTWCRTPNGGIRCLSGFGRRADRYRPRALHILAVVQLRNPTEGRTYFDGKKAAGKTPMEAMRAFKRRLSNVVYAQMLADQYRREATGPGGHSGTTLLSSVTDLPRTSALRKKPLPGPGWPRSVGALTAA